MFKMWTVGKIAILLLLFICTIIDLRKRTLPISLLLAGSIVILLTSLWKYEFDFFTMLKGMIPGILLGTISKITREAVGYGDVWIILLLGSDLGICDTVAVVCGAFFLCSIVAAGCLVRRKFRRDTRIPFVPFITVAYVGVILI